MLQVRNLGKPVSLAGRYFAEGADEICFLNITGFRDFPLGDLPMLQASKVSCVVCRAAVHTLLVRRLSVKKLASVI